ncbi:sodium-dependent transporter [candidate division KSB1 bacterium]
MNVNNRGLWGSKIGFIVAASGSAIGLGNIWRFPYLVGENGGAAFVLLYFLCVLLIGFPVMLAEVSMGRSARRNPVGTFKMLAPNSRWRYIGLLGVITGFAILTFYSVIAGYTLGYIFKTLFGAFGNIQSADETKQIFTEFVSDPYLVLVYLSLFLFLNGVIVYKGIEDGIETWSKKIMPVLLILLILLVIRSLTLKGALAGVEFYLKPDLSKITGSTIINALGQAFFSLSLGMGAMITYGSYLSKKDNLVTSVSYVCVIDTLIAFIAGLAIFPALFAMGLSPDQGPSLVFVVIPSIFSEIPGGTYFGTGFFILLAIAALTSTISLLEVAVAYVIEEWKWSRGKATVVSTIGAFIIAVPSALSGGMIQFFTKLPFYGGDFLSLVSSIFGSYSITIGSLLLAVFVGWWWGVHLASEEITNGNSHFKIRKLWHILIKYVSPIAILLILSNLIKSSFF